MESNSQEKKNLMQDMPIDRIAGGAGSWMSKHSLSAGSPVHKGGSYKGSPAHQVEKPDPKTLINSDGKTQTDIMNSKRSNVDSFRDKIKDLKFNTQEQVDRANSIDLANVNAFNKSNDSISRVNTNYNDKVKIYNDSINNANANIDSILDGSPAQKQGYNARLDESLGTKNGKKSQSLKDRRDESKGMEKSKGKGAYSSDSQMS